MKIPTTEQLAKKLDAHEFIYDNPDTMFREWYEVVINVDTGNVRLKKNGWPWWVDKSAAACSQIGTKEPVWGTYKNIPPELAAMVRKYNKEQP